MFFTLLTASIVWMVLFIASAAFDVWFELNRPDFLLKNKIGRALTVIGITPFIVTIGVSALVALPFVAFLSALSDPYDKGDWWDEVTATVFAVWEWLTKWAPRFIIEGQE